MVIIIISNFEAKRLRLVEDKYSSIPQLFDVKVDILHQAFFFFYLKAQDLLHRGVGPHRRGYDYR